MFSSRGASCFQHSVLVTTHIFYSTLYVLFVLGRLVILDATCSISDILALGTGLLFGCDFVTRRPAK